MGCLWMSVVDVAPFSWVGSWFVLMCLGMMPLFAAGFADFLCGVLWCR